MGSRMQAYKAQKNEHLLKRRGYTGTWAVEMFSAPTERPLFCCTSVLWCVQSVRSTRSRPASLEWDWPLMA